MSWSIWERTSSCSASRRLLGGCDSSAHAALRPDSAGGGCLAERGGGQTGGPLLLLLLLRCGRSDRRGAAPGGVGRSTRRLSCAETQRIPFLEKQPSVKSSDAEAFREKEGDEKPPPGSPGPPSSAGYGQSRWSICRKNKQKKPVEPCNFSSTRLDSSSKSMFCL